MSSEERHRRVSALFEAALDLDPAARRAFLNLPRY